MTDRQTVSTADYEQLKKENEILKLAFNSAKAYIDECPCDPDIYPEQLQAWEEYQAIKDKVIFNTL